MTVHGPERRGPERPGPDYPAEWDQEPEEEGEMDTLLLASVLRKLMAADTFLSLDTHRSKSGMPAHFTLDDTTVEVADAEADAIKAELGW